MALHKLNNTVIKKIVHSEYCFHVLQLKSKHLLLLESILSHFNHFFPQTFPQRRLFVVKTQVFWDMMFCSWVNSSQSFTGL